MLKPLRTAAHKGEGNSSVVGLAGSPGGLNGVDRTAYLSPTLILTSGAPQVGCSRQLVMTCLLRTSLLKCDPRNSNSPSRFRMLSAIIRHQNVVGFFTLSRSFSWI